MSYYAKVYTGDPMIGLLAPGEVLTDEQAEKLGPEKIKELCERGILGALEDSGAPSLPSKPQSEEETSTTAKDPDNTDGGEAETEQLTAEDPDEADGDELPELGDVGDLISEEKPEAPAKPTKKTTKRRS